MPGQTWARIGSGRENLEPTGHGTRGGWRVTVFVLIAFLGTMAACSGKSEVDLAADALAAGLAAHQAGDLEAAAANYNEVLLHDPDNKYAYYNLGLIDQTNGSLASAESNYEQALSIDPDYVPALYNLAIVKTDGGDLGAAIELLRHVVQIDPTNANAHLNLGFALIDHGATEEGQAEIAAAIELDPSLGEQSLESSPTPSDDGPTAT